MQVPSFKVVEVLDSLYALPGRLDDAARLLSSFDGSSDDVLVDGFTALAEGLAPMSRQLGSHTAAERLLLDEAFSAGISLGEGSMRRNARVPGSLDALRAMGVDDPIAAVRRLADEAGMVGVQQRAADQVVSLTHQTRRLQGAVDKTRQQADGTWGYRERVVVSPPDYPGSPAYADRYVPTDAPDVMQATIQTKLAELGELTSVIGGINAEARAATAAVA